MATTLVKKEKKQEEDVVADLIGKLSIGGDEDESTVGRQSLFVRELEKTGFRIFSEVEDKGFFTWKANRNKAYKSLADVSTASAIVEGIDVRGTPDTLVPIQSISLPLHFQNSLPPDERENKFPYGQFEIASLYVAAKHRGVNLQDEIDFCMGGSALEMLARRDASNPYMAMNIPGTAKAILIVKTKSYKQNQSDLGFQFERIVTGRDIRERCNWEYTEHLQVIKVGPYRVLFSADADAVDRDGESVEIKASNPRYWGTKVGFQMISSGSPWLCHGVKGRGQLTRINLRRLSDIVQDATRNIPGGHERLENNILQGLEAIQKELVGETKNQAFKIGFTKASLTLNPSNVRASVLLPDDGVVKDLLL